MQGAVELPDDGVEVAVAVEVGEARRAAEPHVDAVERIGGAGALGEGRRHGRAGVLEIVQGAVRLTPTTASRSPSPSRSAKLGVLLNPTSTPLNGLAAPVRSVKAGAVAEPVFSK